MNADFIALIVNRSRSLQSVAERPRPDGASPGSSRVSLMSLLFVFTVTRIAAGRAGRKGCSAMLRPAPVCTFELGHISKGTRLSRSRLASRPSRGVPSGSTVMSSTIRTPWPSRSAPVERDGFVDRRQPRNASPAWIVKRALLLRMYSKRVEVTGGRVSDSTPAMSNPTDAADRGSGSPAPRSPASGRQCASRSPGSAPRSDGPVPRPHSPRRRSPPALPPRPRERQPAVDVQFGSEPDLGVDDVFRPRGPPRIRRPPGASASGVCMTPTVWANGSRLAHQRAAVRGGAEVRTDSARNRVRQLVISRLLGEFEDPSADAARRRVIVQQRLGRLPRCSS